MTTFWRSLALAAAVNVATPALAGPATPPFQMPFPPGETWRVHSYSGHGYQNRATDWNRDGDVDDWVLAGIRGTARRYPYHPQLGNYVDVFVSNTGGKWVARYAHLQPYNLVADGAVVGPLTTIGRVGQSGTGSPHLHYEQRLGGVPQHVSFGGTPIVYKYWDTSTYVYWSYSSQNSATTDLWTLYRYFNTQNGNHFYTHNFGELGDGGGSWNREADMGRVWVVSGAYRTRVYRYYNNSTGHHFYSTNFQEMGYGSGGFHLESGPFWVYNWNPYANGPTGAVLMRRYWNRVTGAHFWTILPNELGNGSGDWVYEQGSSWWQPH